MTRISRGPRVWAACALAALGGRALAEGAGFDAEVVIVAPTPVGLGTGLAPERLPFVAQTTDSDALQRSQALDLSEHLNAALASVSINAAQGNPLQPDLQFRGYTASPLVGLPMGVSVFQNGVRVNEPLGDAVNWDLIPESAIASVTLVGGANPLFGLNTLGGALNLRMKDGFSHVGHEVEVSGGSWDRVATNLQSGGNNGTFGYYLNVGFLDEGGWRDQSPSDALSLYGTLSWHQAQSAVDFSVQYGDSNLIGNGPLPEGLLALDRAAVFTTPDITANNLRAFTLDFSHAFGNGIELSGNAFHRQVDTYSFNGDISPFAPCALGQGKFLIDGLEEDDLDPLGLTDEELCEDNVLGVANPLALKAALRTLAGDATAFALRDLTPTLTGGGEPDGEAINNISDRSQETYGTDVQFLVKPELFGREHYLVAGFNYFFGGASFDSVVELADFDPATRSTEGLGLGTFVGDQATQVRTGTETWGFYFLDNIPLTAQLTLTVGGRYNHTDVRLRDTSGARPELNGDHVFQRFNPTVGATYNPWREAGFYASYSESARAPTPVELACNEGVFEVARRNAEREGRDPEDVNFECRLPNAFLTDPPLEQVVAESVEAGVRGVLFDSIEHRLGYFRTSNRNDIIFQSTGRSTGLFANVDETRREGMELALAGSLGSVNWYAAYSFIEATFQSPFRVLSPNHPAANEDGEVQVAPGSRLPGVPRHQLKLGAETWWRSLSAGLELILNSDQVMRGDEANGLAPVGGWAVVNLRGAWQLRQHAELFARVTNLFDEDYENFGLLGESPAEVLPGLANQGNRFYGVGAPRAAWIGVRLSL